MTTNKFSTKKLVTLAILSALGIPLMFIELAPVPAAPWLKFDLSDLVVYVGAVIYGPIGAVVVAFIKSAVHYLIKGSDVGIPVGQFIAFVSSLAFALPFYYTMSFIKKMIKKNEQIAQMVSLVIGVVFLSVSLSYLTSEWAAFILSKGFDIVEINKWWLTTLMAPFYLVLIAIILITASKVFKITSELIIRLVPLFVGTITLTILLTFLNYIWFTPWYMDLYGWPLPDEYLKYIVTSYAPFNFGKGLAISGLFFIISFRIDHIIRALNLCDDESCVIIPEELE